MGEQSTFILVGGQETHQPPRDHVTEVQHSTTQLIHLEDNHRGSSNCAETTWEHSCSRSCHSSTAINHTPTITHVYVNHRLSALSVLNLVVFSIRLD